MLSHKHDTGFKNTQFGSGNRPCLLCSSACNSRAHFPSGYSSRLLHAFVLLTRLWESPWRLVTAMPAYVGMLTNHRVIIMCSCFQTPEMASKQATLWCAAIALHCFSSRCSQTPGSSNVRKEEGTEKKGRSKGLLWAHGLRGDSPSLRERRGSRWLHGSR